MLTALRVVARNFGEETLQGAYGEALIQQYGGELTDYGLLTRADGQPVQKPLPPQPGLNSMGMRCP